MAEQKFLLLKDIDSYKKSLYLSNYVWPLVINWEYLAKETVGKQFIRSTDSISANIAEGFGRYHKKDKEKFYYNARGSVYESLDWLQKAKIRKLISAEDYSIIFNQLSELPKDINSLISWTEIKLIK